MEYSPLEAVANALIARGKHTLTKYKVFVKLESDNNAVFFGSPMMVDLYIQEGIKRSEGEIHLPIPSDLDGSPLEQVHENLASLEAMLDANNTPTMTPPGVSQNDKPDMVDVATQWDSAWDPQEILKEDREVDNHYDDYDHVITDSDDEWLVERVQRVQIVAKKRARKLKPFKLKLAKKSLVKAKTIGRGRPPKKPMSQVCEICNYKADCYTKLAIHMNKHVSPGSHTCIACGQIFKFERFLFIHYEKQHKHELLDLEQKTTQNLSSEQLEYREKLMEVKERADAIRPYQCSVCKKRFKVEMYMICHFENKHGEKKKTKKTTKDQRNNGDTLEGTASDPDSASVNEYQVVEADIEDQIKAENVKSMNAKGDEPGDDFVCLECDKIFSTQRKFLKHQKRHGIKKAKLKRQPIYCPHCNLACDRPSRLKRHLEEKHERKNLYSCALCSKGFRRKYHLDRHLETFHDPDKEQARLNKAGDEAGTPKQPKNVKARSTSILCEQCGFVSKTPANLRRHVWKMHEGGGTHSCTHCAYTCKTATDLKKHIVKHSNEKPFTCEFCGQCFKSKHHMKRHQNAVHHQGLVKRYPCPKCQATFSRMEHLRRHQSIHETSKQFSCQWCSQTFARLEYVKIHERRHTGEQPYQCSVCSKGFYDASSLRKHEKTSHANSKMHTCSECGKKFFDGNRLFQHQMKYHDHPDKEEFLSRAVIIEPPKNLRFPQSDEYHFQKNMAAISAGIQPPLSTSQSLVMPFNQDSRSTKPGTQALDTIDSRAITQNLPQVRDVPVAVSQHMCIICGEVLATHHDMVVHLSHHDNFSSSSAYHEPQPAALHMHGGSHQQVAAPVAYPQGLTNQESQAAVNTVITAMQAIYSHQPQQ